MSFNIQWVPNNNILDRLVAQASSSLRITSPFVTEDGVRAVLRSNVRPQLITKVTASNLASKSLDSKALVRLLESGAEIRSIPNLHAKIYLVDGTEGVVTSSNLTRAGLFNNVELGIHFYNEELLYEEVSKVFESLWQRAGIVTLESLEALKQKTLALTFDSGIWREKEPSEVAEPQTATPAIGYLHIPEPSTAPEATVQSKEEPILSTRPTQDSIAEGPIRLVPDESGDLFSPLPPTAKQLLRQLSSEAFVVQAALNSIGLTSPLNFCQWLDTLGPTDFAALVSSAYPYKKRVMERMIRDGSASSYLAIIRALTRDSSNEAQLIKYMNLLEMRLVSNQAEAVELIIPGVLELVRELSCLPNESTLTTKNFNRPNADRLRSLLISFEPDVAAVAQTAQKRDLTPTPEVARVPSFQEIKRARESQGNSFRDYFLLHLPALESGLWDSHLSSLLSLFKELSKITLTPNDHHKACLLAGLVRSRLDTEALQKRTNLLSELGKWETAMGKASHTANERLLGAARLELNPDGPQAVRKTGQLVSLYGQLTKNNHAPGNKDLKNLLDWLTTYLIVRNLLSTWATETTRKKK